MKLSAIKQCLHLCEQGVLDGLEQESSKGLMKIVYEKKMSVCCEVPESRCTAQVDYQRCKSWCCAFQRYDKVKIESDHFTAIKSFCSRLHCNQFKILYFFFSADACLFGLKKCLSCRAKHRAVSSGHPVLGFCCLNAELSFCSLCQQYKLSAYFSCGQSLYWVALNSLYFVFSGQILASEMI